MNQADAAISLAGAAPLAMETAQLVLLDGDLGQLPEAFTVSRDLHRRLSVTLGAWGAYGLVAVARAIVSNGSILGSTAFYGAMMAGSGLYSAWPVLTAPRRSPARHGPAPGGPPEPAVAPA